VTKKSPKIKKLTNPFILFQIVKLREHDVIFDDNFGEIALNRGGGFEISAVETETNWNDPAEFYLEVYHTCSNNNQKKCLRINIPQINVNGDAYTVYTKDLYDQGRNNKC
jgi:hypothetical protein